MEIKVEIGKQLPKDLHHAYCIESGNRDTVAALTAVLEKRFTIQSRGNPDFLVMRHETFGIEEGRQFKELHALKGATSGRRFFLVAALQITREAQNQLLKTFEEPPTDTHLFLIVPSAEILLPTLRSRLEQIRLEMGHNVANVEVFLAATLKERLESIKELISEKNISVIESFLGGLEKNFGRNAKSGATALKEIYCVRRYIRDRGASVKLLLEHLALVLPEV